MRNPIRFELRGIRRVAVVLLACAAVLAAQDDEPFDEPYERVAFGIRLGALFTDLMETGSSQTFIDDDPFILATEISTAPKKRFFLGPTVQFNVKPRLGVNVEFLTRKVEFTRSITLEQEDRDGILQFFSTDSTRTRARYWDVPLQVRYYFGPPDGRPRAYVAGGAVFRFVRDLKATLDTTDAEGDKSTKNIDGETANKNPVGGIAGIGVQLTDDIGIKVEIEGRYTYWLNPAFAVGFSNSAQSQIELAVGFSF
jgi:hypothetical protein